MYLAESAEDDARVRDAAFDLEAVTIQVSEPVWVVEPTEGRSYLLGDHVHDEVARKVNALGVPRASDERLNVVLSSTTVRISLAIDAVASREERTYPRGDTAAIGDGHGARRRCCRPHPRV